MADFKTVLVKDSCIGDITSDIDFAVMSGASQTTYQRFPSTSSSNSAVIFNVQVPSENVVIGRDILCSTALQFTFRINSPPANQAVGTAAAVYGQNFSLQAFPLNSLFSTATCQINNTTVSINTQDVLPAILRMNNSRELYRYNSMTPSLPDQAYFKYSDATGATNNPLAPYNTASFDLDQVPRGAFPATIQVGHYNATTNVYIDASPYSSAPNDGATPPVYQGEYWVVNVKTIVTEPLFLSPWIWGNPEFNAQGLLGINNMAFTLTVDSSCKRLASVALPANNTQGAFTMGSNGATADNGLVALGVSAIAGVQASNSNGFTYTSSVAGVSSVGINIPPTAPVLLFKFLSTQPSDLIQTKNIVPYHDYPRYLSSQANSSALAAGASTTLTSNNLQINQIPDLFLITIRKAMSTQTALDSMSQLVINNISINLNNQSGLLSSASQYDLWRLSERNGSTQSFNEFCGQQTKLASGSTPALIPTTGAILVLNPAYDLSLPDYITCGSLGNYNFQFNVNVTNQSAATINNVEICVVCVNSGIFTTQQGVSAVYTGILTKEMVLGAKSGQQASAMTSCEVARMVGGKKMMPLTAFKGMRKGHGGMMGAVSSGGMSGAVSSGAGRAKKYC
jgi:hypothetical protein